jgi:hypothetical protein
MIELKTCGRVNRRPTNVARLVRVRLYPSILDSPRLRRRGRGRRPRALVVASVICSYTALGVLRVFPFHLHVHSNQVKTPMVRIGTVMDRHRCFLHSMGFQSDPIWIRAILARMVPVRQSVHLFHRLPSLFPNSKSQGVFPHSEIAMKNSSKKKRRRFQVIARALSHIGSMKSVRPRHFSVFCAGFF